MDWGNDHLRLGHSGGIQGRPAPSHFERKAGKVDNATVTAETAQIMRCAHENTVRWARFNAHRAENALGIVDRVAGHPEAFAFRFPFFADVDAIDGTRPRTTIARDTAGQVVPVESPVSCRNRHGLFWVFVLVSEGTAILFVGYQPVPHRNPHSLGNGENSQADVS